LPELLAGYAAAPPASYPASCRPQAWAAAVSPALVTALLGLDPDVPAGRVRIRPLPGAGELEVDNIRIGGDGLGVRVARDGEITITRRPAGLTVTAAEGGG
jgi:glycogen debranching enzyme